MEFFCKNILSIIVDMLYFVRKHKGRPCLPLYLKAVFNLTYLDLYSSSSRSFIVLSVPTESTKELGTDKMSRNNLLLRSCKQHPSVGCCLPLTAYRSSIGGKRTRYPRINSNTINTAQTSFALFPLLERLLILI